MKAKPILFSGPMVQAILEGRKTQTRRIVKPQPEETRAKGKKVLEVKEYNTANTSQGLAYYWKKDGYGEWESSESFSPKYQTGDILWVRETFTEGSDSLPFVYRAGYPDYIPAHIENIPAIENMKWKPSIFMPKAACRIFLKVTDVRVERLQDITEQDAKSEGVFDNNFNANGITQFKSGFHDTWESIHGKGSWNDNPWGWVYSFEKIEKPKKLEK